MEKVTTDLKHETGCIIYIKQLSFLTPTKVLSLPQNSPTSPPNEMTKCSTLIVIALQNKTYRRSWIGRPNWQDSRWLLRGRQLKNLWFYSNVTIVTPLFVLCSQGIRDIIPTAPGLFCHLNKCSVKKWNFGAFAKMTDAVFPWEQPHLTQVPHNCMWD